MFCRFSLLCLLLTCAATHVWAGGEQADEAFRAGVQAFEEGELEEAQYWLEQARELGLESQSLTYNLAVVHYRLGHYQAARRLFTRLLDSGDNALAQYNLGLVELADNRHAEARQWFQRVISESAPDKLRRLARRQLERLQAGSFPEAESSRRWSGYVNLAGGYDDNIASLPEASASGSEGGFAEVMAAGSVLLWGEAGNGFQLEGAGYSRHYPSDQRFNTDLVQLGGAWRYQAETGRFELAATASESRLDAQTLERQYGLRLGFLPVSCWLPGRDLYCRFTFSTAAIAGGDTYEAYDGVQHQWAVEASKSWGSWRLDGSYRAEYNRREDFESGGQFVSLSPMRHQVEAGLSYGFTEQIRAGLEAGFRHSHYRDAHRLLIEDSIIEERRVDQRVGGGVVLHYAFNQDWLLRADWMAWSNDSSLDRYEYRRQTGQIGIERVF